MIAAVLLASIAPTIGKSGGVLRLDLVGNIGVFVIFFLHGMGLSTESLLHGASRWKLHLLVQLCTYAMFPLWWWVLQSMFGRFIPHDLLLGFFYLAALPSTVSSSVAMTGLARGNVAAAVLNATLSTLLGVLLTPLLCTLVFGGQDSGNVGGTQQHALNLGDTMLKIATQLLLPFVIGQVLRPFVGKWFQSIKAKTQLVDRGVILLLVWCSFSDSVADGLWSKHGWELVLITLFGAALFLFPMLWFSNRVAHALGLPVEDRIVAVFCGSKKTLASGVPMARLLFAGNPSLGLLMLPIMCYHQLQLFVCSMMAKRYAARIPPQKVVG